MAACQHSVHVDPARCVGCVACTLACPTKAVRVRGNRARTDAQRCIDCGACTQVCPKGAAKAVTTPAADLPKFKHSVVVPSMSLFGQFGPDVRPAQVMAALRTLGFDDTFDLSWMCEAMTRATDDYLSKASGPWPKISVTCPAIVRLVQIRYPELVANLLPVASARELAAKLARSQLMTERSLAPEDIGLFFVTPCTAMMNSILHPLGPRSNLDAALSMAELHGPLLRALKTVPEDGGDGVPLSAKGLLWAMAGGELAGMRDASTITVHGLGRVTSLFDRIESGTYQSIDFVEAYMCADGCVSGGLTTENPHVAQRNIQRIARWLESTRKVKEEPGYWMQLQHLFDHETELRATPVAPFPQDLRQLAARRKERAALLAQMPGKNCGACGAPGCETLVDDVLRGEAQLEDCVFVKIQRLKQNLAARKAYLP
jgi:iron only hydrogenase large subunit-like protein